MVYSINIRQLDFGDFDGYDEDGNSTGSYSSGDIWLSGTVSSKFRFLSYGISSGLYYSRLSQSESLVLVNTVAGMFHIKSIDMKVAYILKNSGLVLKKYSKTILYTGGGVINSGPKATQLLRELVSLTGFPITSTLQGLGAFPGYDQQLFWLILTGR